VIAILRKQQDSPRGVAAQILQHELRATERRFQVDDPVLSVRGWQPGVESLREGIDKHPYGRVRDTLRQRALTVFQSTTNAAAYRAQSIAANLASALAVLGQKKS
jgi:hypothetical protein